MPCRYRAAHVRAGPVLASMPAKALGDTPYSQKASSVIKAMPVTLLCGQGCLGSPHLGRKALRGPRAPLCSRFSSYQVLFLPLCLLLRCPPFFQAVQSLSRAYTACSPLGEAECPPAAGGAHPAAPFPDSCVSFVALSAEPPSPCSNQLQHPLSGVNLPDPCPVPRKYCGSEDPPVLG